MRSLFGQGIMQDVASCFATPSEEEAFGGGGIHAGWREACGGLHRDDCSEAPVRRLRHEVFGCGGQPAGQWNARKGSCSWATPSRSQYLGCLRSSEFWSPLPRRLMDGPAADAPMGQGAGQLGGLCQPRDSGGSCQDDLWVGLRLTPSGGKALVHSETNPLDTESDCDASLWDLHARRYGDSDGVEERQAILDGSKCGGAAAKPKGEALLPYTARQDPRGPSRKVRALGYLQYEP